ncbi:acetyltransferase [Winogradskyella sp.]|jgi:sugar O-acyltransferase (sialic acid O-acetyltransferase NeuD family)|uniref:acetyltransferase n=1 Tax=Winogradskyella sp. TaxID=1883156 RepID=UPI0025E4BF94|nr:acetyltransferase [Winogradskyella sp.]MCT4629745.1 acetyltransferase [Winogradskyella sp.]
MKNILIYGASGHAKMIVDIILKNNDYNLIGFIDSYKPINDKVYGHKVIGNLDSLSVLIKKFNISGIVIGIGDNELRHSTYKSIKKIAPHIEFVPIVHPSAILAEDILVPEGAVLMAGTIVNANAKLGKFCLLNTKASLGHDSIMSDFSSLSSGVTIAGNVKIGLCSSICLSASVSQGVTIGDHTIIGGASLVLKPVGDYKLAFGVPISTIKDRVLDLVYSA